MNFNRRPVTVNGHQLNVIVEGDYQLNLAMSFWRSNDGTAQGYLVSTLDTHFRQRAADRQAAALPAAAKLVRIATFNSNSEKPVTGRDSDGASRTASKTATHDPIAESVAGSISPDAGSASLLPVVSP